MTLIFGEGSCVNEIEEYKSFLGEFQKGSGLKLNVNRCQLFVFRMFEEEGTILASCFGCSLGVLPFLYLGTASRCKSKAI